MKDDIAIRVDGVYKNFLLPHEKNNSLKTLFVSAAKKKDKGYEVQHALKDISFEVKKGEFFGIVGRNGSGKSTLLKIIAEIYQPTKGKILKAGKLVPFIELGVGFNPELTGRENVYLNGALLGFSVKEIEDMYDDIVQFAELERFMDQKLKNYSSGMQVRLAFSVATRSKADILLIDEVLAVGDADFQRKCFSYFKELKRNHATVIFVSHDMEAIKDYCDRAALIDGSVLVEVGKPNRISGMYAQLFIDNQIKEESGEKKWGNGIVDIRKPTLEIKQKKAILSYEVYAKEDVENILYGFSMRDMRGLQIIGSNSKINNEPTMSITKGSSTKVICEFQDVFSDGRYIFDIALLSDDGQTVYCWWNDALIVSIKKLKNIPAILDYPIETRLE